MNQREAVASRLGWQRWIWLACSAIALATGVVGIVLPILPTTPFVLIAGYCFSRGNEFDHRLVDSATGQPHPIDAQAASSIGVRIR